MLTHLFINAGSQSANWSDVINSHNGNLANWATGSISSSSAAVWTGFLYNNLINPDTTSGYFYSGDPWFPCVRKINSVELGFCSGGTSGWTQANLYHYYSINNGGSWILAFDHVIGGLGTLATELRYIDITSNMGGGGVIRANNDWLLINSIRVYSRGLVASGGTSNKPGSINASVAGVILRINWDPVASGIFSMF